MESKHIQAMLDMDAEECLQHYGVLGMHWGVRRFQPYSLIPRKSGEGGKEVGAAKKKSKISAKSVVSKVTPKKKSRNQKSEEAKAEYVEKAKTARQRHEELDRIVNSGNAKLVYEHRDEMTNKQLEDAIARINVETRVAALVRQQNPTTLDKVKQFAGKVDDVNSVIKTGLNTEKNISDIRKIAKEANKAQKAAKSSEALQDIINNGAKAEDVYKRQSELSGDDLKKAVERIKNLDQDMKVIRSDNKFAKNMSEKNQANIRETKKELNDALDKYGENYTRQKYSDKTSNKLIDAVLVDRAQALADEQAANRYESQKRYDELQAKRKRTGKK